MWHKWRRQCEHDREEFVTFASAYRSQWYRRPQNTASKSYVSRWSTEGKCSRFHNISTVSHAKGKKTVVRQNKVVYIPGNDWLSLTHLFDLFFVRRKLSKTSSTRVFSFWRLTLHKWLQIKRWWSYSLTIFSQRVTITSSFFCSTGHETQNCKCIKCLLENTVWFCQ